MFWKGKKNKQELLENPRRHHYVYAHNIIRDFCNDDPSLFFGYMGSPEKDVLVGFFWHKVCEFCDQEEITVLCEKDFKFTCLSLSEFPTILVEMPKPKAITEAFYVAIVLLANMSEDPAPENPNARYFVLELGQFDPDQNIHGVIGEWIEDKNSTSNNKHLNYGISHDMSINSFLQEVEQHVVDKNYSYNKLLLSTTVTNENQDDKIH